MDVRKSIAATLAYSSFFKFPLYPNEIHYWLVSPKSVSMDRLKQYLPPDMSPSNHHQRQQSLRYSRIKIARAQKLAKRLIFIPGLKMVAATGSVAALNSQKNDDIDLLFITSKNTLWVIRPLVIAIISLFFRRRHPKEDHSHTPNAFCPNLWLDMHSLEIPFCKQSLYTAHEALQIVPIIDKDFTYHRFLKANSWTKKYLANTYTSLINKNSVPVIPVKAEIHQVKSLMSSILTPLNYLLYQAQLLYMKPKRTTEFVNLHSAYLHTTNYSSKIESHLKTQKVI